ncbi:MAG TPA: tetratricopeptide repeat protein [Blastocatellia bacterium]|nr:tetratricopeptide repeat protein [Blastocatellia bacterium]
MRRLIGLGLLAVSMLATNACRSTDAAAKSLLPCEIALADHDGNSKLDEEIRSAQKKIRSRQNTDQVLPEIEKLGWHYVEKARASFDPGYYKLAEQCAACLEAKLAQPVKAETAAQTFAPLSPKAAKASALLLRGHVLHSLHRFAEAETIARELATSRGLAFDFGLLGDVLMEQGKLDESIAAYQKMMDLKPSPQAYSRAAHVRWLQGDLDGARVLMRMSAQGANAGDAEASAWAWSKLALYELQAGALKQAVASCELALELQPGYAPALLAQGRVLLAENKFNEAVPLLERAARQNPLPEYRWTLADALRAAGRNDEAQKVEAELNSHGAGDDPRSFAVYLATRGEQLLTALKLAENELKNRRDVFTLDALAWAQSAAGNHDQAWQTMQQTMQQALATGTKDARLFLHAAVIAAKSNQPTEARQFAKRASAIQSTLLPSERNQLAQLKL